ncbi:hypothetical protein DOS84_00565 [Flavobacterium aquariorum]|uniref:Uncharacterized protein n=2 Tax=Flavobacterium aquariorum TaxID=2217670 RepID=A0A2W7U0Q0_9FLAO|nr:hypothetical protein DOS84_00565 [Flavobacterium aquariorum]
MAKSGCNNKIKYLVMFENIDELIEVNLKLLYTSKSQFMMRINFKDECGFNLKNSKVFAEILDHKGLVVLEKEQGFRCDLTDFGKQIYESGGWNKYLKTVELFEKSKNIVNMDCQVNNNGQSFLKKIMIASIIILVLCFFITLLTVEIFKTT